MNEPKGLIIPADTWREQEQAHLDRAREWTEPYRERRAAGDMHPIHDFLFIYYRISPAQLEAWHPRLGIGVEMTEDERQFSSKFYRKHGGIIELNPAKITSSTLHRLQMALQLCETVGNRPPRFACYGLHEWAMVYRGDKGGDVRHAEKLPLRLSQPEIDRLVESQPICCSHFDAFRFFTPSAQSFNCLQPSKDSRILNEQSGCLHTNMDLYKLAGQSMPWIGSDLLWESFALAVKAREIDMRASPYDCTSLGYAAIPVETAAGRLAYDQAQRELHLRAQPIRDKLIDRLRAVVASVVPITESSNRCSPVT